MAVVLLYNLSPDKRKKVGVALTRLGLHGRTVVYAEYGHPVGYLAGREGFAPAKEYTGENFTSEMMVMSGLASRQFSTLLDMLRATRATVPLKAVVNENNAAWNSYELYKALRTEHDTMLEYRAARKT